MTNEKPKKGVSAVQAIAANRKALAPTEYTNYDDYINAQKNLTDHVIKQPARTCEMCGYAMDYNGHVLSERETKWSVHDVCQKKVDSMLDRQTGITRERREMERIASRRRH